MAKNAVLDWEEKLKESEENKDNLWNTQVVIISEEDSENCGITIYLKDKPSLTGTVAGFFTWPPGSITIYYLQLEVCGLFTCYDDETFISDDTIYAIALHEIGHSFGLDHYVSDNADTNSKWQTSLNTPPSIMIPAIHNNPFLQEITNIDTSKVSEIYGSEGFYAFSSLPIPEPTPEIIAPIIPDRSFSSVRISEKIIEVQDQQQQIIKISGSVSEDKLLRGHPVIITVYYPDQSIQILKTGTASSGYFETLLIFDKNSIRGNYHVSVSYIEHVDKSKDVSFEIVDKITSPSIVLDEQDIELPIIPNPNESNQMDVISDEIIPQWVKNNVKWWSEGNIDDETFVDGIEFLMKIGIVTIN